MHTTPRHQRSSSWITRTLIITALGIAAWVILPARYLSQLQPAAQAAGSFTVNSLADTADASAGNGLCADSTGACTLRAAIQEANALAGAETIDFSVTGTIELTAVLPDILSDLTINGPGPGSLTVRRNTGGNYRIFFNNNRIVNISGITVTNGRTADGVDAPTSGGNAGFGGGILNAGTMTLTDVVITGNATGNGGNALQGGSTFGGPGGFGAGISSTGSLTMKNATISNNTTGNGGNGGFGHTGGRGGGVNATGTLNMTNCVVSGNQTGNGGVGSNGGASGGSGGDGAGIHVDNGVFQFVGTTVTNNHAGNGGFQTGTGGNGGGLLIVGTATIINSSISNNVSGSCSRTGFAPQDGIGGGILNAGVLTIIGTTISNNSAGVIGPDNGGRGGGIYNGATLKMVNSTLSGNSASDRGGAIAAGGTTNLTNVTIFNNSALGFGGGIHAFTGPAIVLNNTIVAGNVISPSSTPSDIDASVQATSSFNLIGTGGSGGLVDGTNGNKVGANPMLGPLAANGGPTQTHALLVGSPALDSGSNALAKDPDNNTLTMDQRGASRFANSAAPGTGTVDIGAYEFHPVLEDVPDKTTNEDTPLSVSFSIGDGVAVSSVTATSDNQTLIPDANLTLSPTGSVRTLLISPATNESGTAHITITVNESGGGIKTDSFLVTVLSVNDAPTFTKGSDQTVNEDAGAQTVTNWATNIGAGAPNESGQTLTFNVTGNTNASLFSSAPAIASNGTLTYTPAADAFGVAVITVALADNGGTANGGVDTSAAQTFTITVNPVNDAPSFTKGADQTVNEDSGTQQVSNWATNISAGPNEQLQPFNFVVTNNSNPSLFSGSVFINFSGGLLYTPASNANGSANITVVLKDNGGTANGGQDTSVEQTFTITVNSVNDAPVNQLPFSPSTPENTPLVFSTATTNTISVTDVDAGSDSLTVSLSITQGTLSLGTTAGLVFSVGDGVDDTTMTFDGALTVLNAALNGLTFKPTQGFSGNVTLQMISNDQGHNGSGGAKSDTDSLFITVRDGGVLQFSGATHSVNEDTAMAVITVVRNIGIAGSTSISYQTANGTATGGATCGAGVDYINTSGTLSWAHNEFSPKTFTVPLCVDATNELDETVTLTLSNVTGSGALGTPNTATLTIVNDDLPVLLTEENSDRAIALDSVTLTRDPFSLLNPFYFGADHRRRVSLFVWRLGLLPTDTAGNVAAVAEDDQGTPYPLQVEFVGPVVGPSDVTQVVVRLPDSVVGTPRDLFVKVTLRGPGSNRGRISITGP